MASSVGKFLHQGEVDSILKREREKRRKDRIINVRQQSVAFAREIRIAVKNEKDKQLCALQSQLKDAWLVQRKQRIEELGKVYGDCLMNIGQGHENAINEDKRKREKESANLRHREKANARGLEAERRLRMLKEKETNEAKQPSEQRQLVKVLEKKRARVVASRPKKPSTVQVEPKQKEPTDSKPDDQQLISRIPGVALPPVLIIKSHVSDQINAAMAAEAIEEMNRLRESEEKARKQELEKKAQQRFLIALKNERIRIEYARLITELEQLEKDKSCDSCDTLEESMKASKTKHDLEMSIEELFRDANVPFCTSLSKSTNGTIETLPTSMAVVDHPVSATATVISSDEHTLNDALLQGNMTDVDAVTEGKLTDEEDKCATVQQSAIERTCIGSPSILEEKSLRVEISTSDESIIAGQFNSDVRTIVSDLGSLTISSDIGNSTIRTPVTVSSSSGTLSMSEIGNEKSAVPSPIFAEANVSQLRVKSPIEVRKLNIGSRTQCTPSSSEPATFKTSKISHVTNGKAQTLPQKDKMPDTRNERLREMLLSIIAAKPRLVSSATSDEPLTTVPAKSCENGNTRLSTILEVDSLNMSTEPSILGHVDNDIVKQRADESSWMNYHWNSNSKISAVSNSTLHPRVNFSPSVTSIKDLTGIVTLSSDSSNTRSQPGYYSRSSSSNYTSTPLRRSTSPEIQREMLSGNGITDEPDLTLVSSTTLISITESEDESSVDIADSDWPQTLHQPSSYYQDCSISESLQSFLRNESMLRTPELPSRILRSRSRSGSVDESLQSFLQHEINVSSFSFQ